MFIFKIKNYYFNIFSIKIIYTTILNTHEIYLTDKTFFLGFTFIHLSYIHILPHRDEFLDPLDLYIFFCYIKHFSLFQ